MNLIFQTALLVFMFWSITQCYDPVEPLHYAAGFDPICVYCASEEVQDSGTGEAGI